MKKLIFILMQICNILAIYCIICYILDIFNPLMKFIDNNFSKMMILILAILVLATNQILIWMGWPGKKNRGKLH